MNWANEFWVKLFIRDTTDWLTLSWQARGLFALLLRIVSRNGELDLGRTGLPAVAVHLRAQWPEIEQPLAELIKDGCVQCNGSTLVIRNFCAAQHTPQSNKARQQAHRERCRDTSPQGKRRDSTVTNRDEIITDRDDAVTRGHTPSHAVTTRGEKIRENETGASVSIGNAPSQVVSEPRDVIAKRLIVRGQKTHKGMFS